MNTKKLAGIGALTAIVVILQLLGGGIKFSMFSITLVLIPIVVGAALYGWKAGLWLGTAFGVAVLMSGDAGAFLSVDVLGTILVVLLKGALCGTIAGFVYQLLSKVNAFLATVCAALICPVVNTGVFLLGCLVFFMPTINQWALQLGYTDAGSYMILGLVGINFLVEVGVNIVLVPVVTRLVRLSKQLF